MMVAGGCSRLPHLYRCLRLLGLDCSYLLADSPLLDSFGWQI